MQRIIILTFMFLTTLSSLFGGEIVLSGIYQGKNIYVMNPFAIGSVGFCVSKVTVNGQLSTDEINSSAFEIDLSVYDFQVGEKVVVVIEHCSNCVPKILNAEVLKPVSSYKASLMKVNLKTEELIWTTTKEKGSLPFYIEQFRWNKWIRLGKVQGKGRPQKNTYSYKILVHSGLNKYRIRQRDFTGVDNISRPIQVRSQKRLVTYSPKKPSDKITFSDATLYEIYDMQGVKKTSGYGKEIILKDIPEGEYFFNFDAQTEIIKIK